MKFKHGDRVTCEINGEYIDDARVSINASGKTYICQNRQNGINAENKFGYSYSWMVDKDFISTGAKNLKLKEKTLDDLEVGDILVGEYGNKKVLGICGLVYFLSRTGNFNEAEGLYTIEEIKHMHILKQQEEPEEITMAQLEKELGRKVKIIK